MNCTLKSCHHDNAVPLSRCAAYALDLARARDGYLVLDSEMIDELRDAGLVRVKHVGGGFVIVKAMPAPAPSRRAPDGRWARAIAIGEVRL